MYLSLGFPENPTFQLSHTMYQLASSLLPSPVPLVPDLPGFLFPKQFPFAVPRSLVETCKLISCLFPVSLSAESGRPPLPWGGECLRGDCYSKQASGWTTHLLVKVELAVSLVIWLCAFRSRIRVAGCRNGNEVGS